MSAYNGPDDLLAALSDDRLWDAIAIARLWPDVAIAEAEKQTKHLREKKANGEFAEKIPNTDEALHAIAAVAAPDKRGLLIGMLGALRLGVDKKLIEDEVDRLREEEREERRQARARAESEEQNRTDFDSLGLVRRLIKFYQWRRDVPPGLPLIEALFCLLTRLYDVCDTLPYMLYSSAVPGCGKSISIERHEAVCNLPRIIIEPTPATIYRMIESEHGTILFDEAEILDDRKSTRAAEMRALFNGGYKKGARVPRCEEEDGKQVVKWYDLYCPKVIGKIGNFYDTLLSRGITSHLNKAYDQDQSFADAVEETAAPLRRLLDAYAVQKRKALVELYKEERHGSSWRFLKGREYELWVPLLLHAKLIAGECDVEGREFEAEAVAIAERFTASKAKLIILDDKRTALTLELLEVLNSTGNLSILDTERKNNPEWKKSDANRITAGALIKDLVEKESWGVWLEKKKTDKTKAQSVGYFLRNFQPESWHDKNGTQYNFLDLARRLVQHVPPEITEEKADKDKDSWKLLRDLVRTSGSDSPASQQPAVKLSPDNPSDSSETGYVVTTRVVTDQPVSNEGVESSGDNLTDKQQEEDDSDTSFDVEEF